MTSRLSPEAAIQAATEIVVAFLQGGSISQDELPGLVRKVRAAVEDDLEPRAARDDDPVSTRPVPPVAIADSVHHDYLVSLEDGQQYRTLRRHLMSKYGLTPEAYRARWGLPADYPMVAPGYAAARSDVAKRSGLGHHRLKPKASRRGR
jgi:predicted transcriptional regulator